MRNRVIAVRGDTALGSEVASLLPFESKRARNSIADTRSKGVIRTTFCLICGGNKRKSSLRCAACRNRAMHDDVQRAARAGLHASGRKGAARALIADAIIRANPGSRHMPLESSYHVHTAGHNRVQAWERKVLVDGQWIPESQVKPT